MANEKKDVILPSHEIVVDCAIEFVTEQLSELRTLAWSLSCFLWNEHDKNKHQPDYNPYACKTASLISDLLEEKRIENKLRIFLSSPAGRSAK